VGGSPAGASKEKMFMQGGEVLEVQGIKKGELLDSTIGRGKGERNPLRAGTGGKNTLYERRKE